MMADACTYLPPTCWMTLAYSFSAPTATMAPPEPADGAAAGPEAQALASRTALRDMAAARVLPDRSIAVMIIISIWTRQNEAVTCGGDHLEARSRRGPASRGRRFPGGAARNPAGNQGARDEAGRGARRRAGQSAGLLQRAADPR